jgi:hypothetical protein
MEYKLNPNKPFIVKTNARAGGNCDRACLWVYDILKKDFGVQGVTLEKYFGDCLVNARPMDDGLLDVKR